MNHPIRSAKKKRLQNMFTKLILTNLVLVLLAYSLRFSSRTLSRRRTQRRARIAQMPTCDDSRLCAAALPSDVASTRVAPRVRWTRKPDRQCHCEYTHVNTHTRRLMRSMRCGRSQLIVRLYSLISTYEIVTSRVTSKWMYSKSNECDLDKRFIHFPQTFAIKLRSKGLVGV